MEGDKSIGCQKLLLKCAELNTMNGEGDFMMAAKIYDKVATIYL